MSDEYVTVAEAAQQISVHPSTIRRWIEDGLLPAYRLGRRRLGVRPADLRKLVTPRTAGRKASEIPEPAVAVQQLSKAEQRRGLRALAELERLRDKLATRHGMLAPESWELLNVSRDERSRDVMRAAKE